MAVCAGYPERFEVTCVTCRHSSAQLQAICRELQPKYFLVSEDAAASNLAGEDALCEVLSGAEVDIVLCAIQGIAALRPVLAALRAGKTVCLASKEVKLCQLSSLRP